ncbi:MAG: TlpA family protein disulfide reductase [Muribaculaceae bacterium]|nr:TlpA family protein disulfide reductase [Muribaculaceae bacterium]
MKKIILSSLAIAASIGAYADVTVIFPEGASGEYEVESQLISESVKPRKDRKAPQVTGVSVKDGKVVFPVLSEGPAQSVLYTSEREGIALFTEPGDDLTVEVSSVEPLEYTVKGTPLMETVSLLDAKGNEIKKEYFTLVRSGNPDQSKLAELENRYDVIFADYVKGHSNDPAALYALLQLDGEGYLEMFKTLPESAANSILYPLAENKKNRVEKNLEAEKRMEALQSGNVDAPGFTLKNMEGKDVSLSDFRGKWVILDFWGSWCPWCIKGFPALKEAYAKYQGKLEIIGIDCRDKEDVWKAAVKRYELPWVQVYNPEATAESLYQAYVVNGFPTKVIVSPEGKIANITVGEDPTFFNKLDSLISGK